MPPRRCFWLALLVAAPSRLLRSNAGASAPGSRTRLRGPRRPTNASTALQLVQPGAASNEVVRRLPAPRALDRRRLSDYAQLAKLTASDGAADDMFGRSVAIDGDTIVVGAPYPVWAVTSSNSPGAAYVLRTTDGGATYDQVATLTAADGMPGDQFGWSVAISGSIVVIGATKDNLSGNGGYPTNYGAAYIFRTSDGGSTYAQVVKLAPDEGIDKWDDFGYSVAIDGNVVVIGSLADQISGGTGGWVNEPEGTVYVFRTTDGGDSWSQVARLVAYNPFGNAWFGYSVAISGSTIVVGSVGYSERGGWGWGEAYVFRTTDGGATYVEVAGLTADDDAEGDVFGRSVAIDGGTIVVGANDDDDAGSDSGSAYVFRTSDGGATYDQVAKLTATDAAAGDKFGTSVAVDGGTVAIGAWYGNSAGSGSGSAYVFRTSDGGATYGQVAKLTAADAVADDGFGYSVAIDGDTVVVGALYDGTDSGAAYIFSSDSSWWDYFSSDAATRPLPPAMVLLVAMLAL